MNCIQILLDYMIQQKQNNARLLLVSSLDKWICHVIVQNLSQSIGKSNNTLRESIEATRLQYREQLARQKAIKENKEQSIMRYFW